MRSFRDNILRQAFNAIKLRGSRVEDLYEYLLNLYPNAAAAYSLRSLNSTYTGDCIEVRRDSDNTVLNIGFVNNELDTTTLSTFCAGSNGYVTKWYDQSGNGYDVTQTIASAQPKIFDSATGVIELNGKPSIYTDGIDDQLESGVLSLSNPNTQFFVFKTLVNAVTEYVGGLYNGQNTASSLQGTFLGDNLYLAQQGPAFPPPVPHNQNQILITAKSSTIGTDWQLFKNGSQITNSGENIGKATGNKIVLGNRNSFSFFGENYFQEYILYNSDETGNRVSIETNINQRYNMYWSGATQRLLDTYSGATAAYSLEALNSQYTGAIIQVRRDSDNTVLNIGANYDGSLDVDKLTNFCNGANGFVTIWYDQSGLGRDAIQTTASNQPKIYDSINGIIEVNGKPSLYFDGTGDGFVSSNLAGQARLDTYFVAKPNNDDFYIYPFGENSYGFTAVNNSTNTDLTNNYGTPSLYANSQLFTGTTLGQLHTFLNDTKLVVHQNASTVGWLTYTFGNYVSPFYNFDGYFSEFIAYDNDQSSNRTGIETDINNRYNIY